MSETSLAIVFALVTTRFQRRVLVKIVSQTVHYYDDGDDDYYYNYHPVAVLARQLFAGEAA